MFSYMLELKTEPAESKLESADDVTVGGHISSIDNGDEGWGEVLQGDGQN